MKNSSPFSGTHHHPFPFHDDDNDDIIRRITPPPPSADQIFHQSSGGAFHAPGSSTSILHENHRQLPHFIGGGGGDEDNNYNNLPDQPPSSTAFQPGQHVDPYGITSNQIYEEDSYLVDQLVDRDGLYSYNIDFDFSLENYIDFDPTPQTQDINHSQALLQGGGGVASQPYHEAITITGTQRRQYKRWTHEEMSKLLAAIYEFRKSRYLWEDVKKNHFCDDIGRSTNTLKQKFKEMCKAAAMSSSVRDPKTRELYNRALMLRGEIQQKKASRNHSRGTKLA